jgi:hypothetical protein
MKSESNEITASPKSPVISAVIDVEVLDFSVMFVQFVPISTIIRKMGKDRKRLTHGRLPSVLAFPMAILGIHGELLSILQVFHIPLLYK